MVKKDQEPDDITLIGPDPKSTESSATNTSHSDDKSLLTTNKQTINT